MRARTDLRHALVACAALLAVTLVVFWPVRTYQFLNWDDTLNVTENPYFRHVTGSTIARFWLVPYAAMYIPVTYTVWALEARAAARWAGGGWFLEPRIFHSTNLVCHAVNVLLVFWILLWALRRGVDAALAAGGSRAGSRRGARADRGAVAAACCGALVFAVHPLQVEPVAWVTGLKDVLSGLFALAAVLGLALFSGGVPGTARAVPARWLLLGVLSTVAFLLALGAKPAAVAVPFVAAALLSVCVIGRLGGKNAGNGAACNAVRWSDWAHVEALLSIWVGLAVVWSLWTMVVQSADESGVHVAVWARPFVAADALAFYLYKLVLPVQLAPEYGRAPAIVLRQWWAYVTWLVPAALAVLLVWRRRAVPVLVAAAAIWVAALLPVLGLIPFGYQVYSTVADRYMYVAMLGPALAVAYLMFRLLQRGMRLTGLGVGLVLTLTLLVLTRRQLPTWYDSETFFAHALQVNPRGWALANNLGLLRAHEGKTEEALAWYRRALEANPRYEYAWNNMGRLLSETGRKEEGAACYSKALRLNVKYAHPYNNLGVLHAAAGRVQQAEWHYSKAIELDPRYVSAYSNMGVLLAANGRFKAAVWYYSQGLAIDPFSVPSHINLANALLKMGDESGAVTHYSRAIAALPNSAEAHYNLGNLYGRQGKYAQAAAHFSLALQAQPGLDQARANLALARQRMAGAP